MAQQENLDRYARQTMLASFGEIAQRALLKSKVLVVGAGGLGSPLLQLLCAAGVGNIVLVDDDAVEITNLHRQILYDENDTAKPKAMRAAQRLKKMNSEIQIEGVNESFCAANALKLVAKADLVVDCTDNFHARYCINDACVLLNKPWVYGAVQDREIQVAIFNEKLSNGNRTATLRCVFSESDSDDSAPNCERDGILGTVCATAASIMTDLCLAHLASKPHALQNTLLLMSLQTMQTQQFALQRQSETWPACCLNKEAFTEHYKNLPGQEREVAFANLRYIDITEVGALLSRRTKYPFTILEIDEHDQGMGDHRRWFKLAASQLDGFVATLSEPQEVVVLCERGIRSAHWATVLAKKYSQHQFETVKGGLSQDPEFL